MKRNVTTFNQDLTDTMDEGGRTRDDKKDFVLTIRTLIAEYDTSKTTIDNTSTI